MLDRMNKLDELTVAEAVASVGHELTKLCKRLDEIWEQMPAHLIPRFDRAHNAAGLYYLVPSALVAEADKLKAVIEAQEAAAALCEAQAGGNVVALRPQPT